MDNVSGLLEKLKQAINVALWNSDEVVDSIAALADAAGEVHISVDVVLPPGTDFEAREYDNFQAGILRFPKN
ncbi:MAG TPA: hypothetical protein VKX49_16940 [Bryobacteraceae bacterium]|nr:hypothetical protein [Bryobacteraceae bacterium]